VELANDWCGDRVSRAVGDCNCRRHLARATRNSCAKETVADGINLAPWRNESYVTLVSKELGNEISRRYQLQQRGGRCLSETLIQFAVDQRYDDYTPVDHAVWRFIMRQNIFFLKEYAHKVYFKGLLNTGISFERIRALKR